MTPNCGIRRTVCVPVGTPRSAVLDFILTRKHAGKYKNCFSLPLLMALQMYFIHCLIKIQNSANTSVISKEPYNLQLQPPGIPAKHCVLVLLLPSWCWLMDSYIYIFGLCFLQSYSTINTPISTYFICHNSVCI
jgi:hypothetical protein